jgi:hypothetical protein
MVRLLRVKNIPLLSLDDRDVEYEKRVSCCYGNEASLTLCVMIY